MLKVIITLLSVLKGAEFSPQMGFSTSASTARISGRDPMCVPTNTCAADMGQIIDPRIVTNGPAQVTCNAGEVLCLGVLGGDRCGMRFANVPSADGPTEAFSHPWQAYIMNQTGYTGSGVLLDSRHVLTAAHKVYQNRDSPEQIRVFMGVHNPPTLSNISRRAIKVNINDEFDLRYLKNDIAILTLNEPIPLGYRKDISRLCLPAQGSSAGLAGTSCTVAGWGMTAFRANDAPTSPQKQVRVGIVSYDTCFQSMSKPDVLGPNAAAYLDDKEICAGGGQNKDACTEDGGAPLTCDPNGRYTVAGLVIWGKGCGRTGVYGVYVDVAKYLPWINQLID